MSYHGYVPWLQKILAGSTKKIPTVLEVGIDRGVTLIPLVVALASSHESFLYVGVDIDVQESLQLTVRYLGPSVFNNTHMLQGNSLDVLPKLVEQNMKFDVILLDGDHNYHTVSNELKYLDALVDTTGIVVVDDYDGKWSTRDLWYAERPGYEKNESATRPVTTEKQGVKPAVDEWMQEHPTWHMAKPIQNGEPVLISREQLVMK